MSLDTLEDCALPSSSVFTENGEIKFYEGSDTLSNGFFDNLNGLSNTKEETKCESNGHDSTGYTKLHRTSISKQPAKSARNSSCETFSPSPCKLTRNTNFMEEYHQEYTFTRIDPPLKAGIGNGKASQELVDQELGNRQESTYSHICNQRARKMQEQVGHGVESRHSSESSTASTCPNSLSEEVIHNPEYVDSIGMNQTKKFAQETPRKVIKPSTSSLQDHTPNGLYSSGSKSESKGESKSESKAESKSGRKFKFLKKGSRFWGNPNAKSSQPHRRQNPQQGVQLFEPKPNADGTAKISIDELKARHFHTQSIAPSQDPPRQSSHLIESTKLTSEKTMMARKQLEAESLAEFELLEQSVNVQNHETDSLKPITLQSGLTKPRAVLRRSVDLKSLTPQTQQSQVYTESTNSTQDTSASKIVSNSFIDSGSRSESESESESELDSKVHRRGLLTRSSSNSQTVLCQKNNERPNSALSDRKPVESMYLLNSAGLAPLPKTAAQLSINFGGDEDSDSETLQSSSLIQSISNQIQDQNQDPRKDKNQMRLNFLSDSTIPLPEPLTSTQDDWDMKSYPYFETKSGDQNEHEPKFGLSLKEDHEQLWQWEEDSQDAESERIVDKMDEIHQNSNEFVAKQPTSQFLLNTSSSPIESLNELSKQCKETQDSWKPLVLDEPEDENPPMRHMPNSLGDQPPQSALVRKILNEARQSNRGPLHKTSATRPRHSNTSEAQSPNTTLEKHDFFEQSNSSHREPQTTLGVNSNEGSIAMPALSQVQELLKTRMQELEEEISRYKKEQEKIRKERDYMQREKHTFDREKQEWYASCQEEKEKWEKFVEEETKKIKRDRRIADRQSKLGNKLPDKREREEIENLRAEITRQKEQQKHAVQRWKLNCDRLKKQIMDLTTRNKELEDEIKTLELERLEQWEVSKHKQTKKNHSLRSPSTQINSDKTNSLSSFVSPQPEKKQPNSPQDTKHANFNQSVITKIDRDLDEVVTDMNHMNEFDQPKDIDARIISPMANYDPSYYQMHKLESQWDFQEENQDEILDEVDDHSEIAMQVLKDTIYWTESGGLNIEDQDGDIIDWKQRDEMNGLDELDEWPVETQQLQGEIQDPIEEEKQHPDGKLEQVFASGKKVIQFRNGTVQESFPNGLVLVRFANGDVKQNFPDGKVVYSHTVANVIHTTYPSGLQVIEFENQVERHYPDGTKVIDFADGSHKKILADGSEVSTF